MQTKYGGNHIETKFQYWRFISNVISTESSENKFRIGKNQKHK